MTSPGGFGILGCVEVVGPQGRLEPLGARHRALAAALALQPGTMVPSWRLVEALWGESPPRTALRSLHSHVARLRPMLDRCGFGGVLQTREPGYVLLVEAAAVDASRFEQEVRAIRARLAAGSLADAAESLTATLALWRGPALADAEPTGWTAAQATRLENLRSAVLADRCETLLCLGNYGEALTELEPLLSADPMGERLVGLHMIALWGCGRPAEAFAAYHRLRTDLAGELGVDPSKDMADLHTAMLRGATTAQLRAPGSVVGLSTVTIAQSPRPAQLPAPVGYFTGRAQELQALDEAAAGGGAPTVALICGHGGIGKTSLAVQWAHRAADRFPDGHVFIDAHGNDKAAALSPARVVGALLRCLGVPEDRMPGDLDERVGLYRSLIAGKRMLIVLDDAGGTEQVAPIVPSSAGTVLVVTSRSTLAALMTHAEVSPLVLGMLSQQESADLFTKVLGAQRVSREPQEVARLAELCCRMPLALRIAAAKLVTQPGHSIAALADEVCGDDRLAQLRVEDGARSVEAVFASAYQALSAQARHLFRRLGLHPGPHFGAPLAAALAQGADHQRALAELAAVHLISQPQPGRYRMHDLVRLFAKRCAEAGDGVELLFDWYLAVADAANRVLDPGRDRLTATLTHTPPQVPFPPVREKALDFIEPECDNLLAVVRHAADHGHWQVACELTYLLNSFFAARGHWSERIEMCQHAVRAAALLGDPRVEAEMHRALGMVYRASHQLGPALDSHLRALPLLRALRDRPGLAYLYNNIGGTHAELRRFDEAVEAYQTSLELHREAGNDFGAVAAQRNLGYVYIRMGQAQLSLPHLEQALALSRALGHGRLEAGALDSLGEANLQLGRHDHAVEHFRAVLEVSRGIGDLKYEMDALVNLGLAHLERGEAGSAVESLTQALTIARAMGHRHAEARTLNQLGQAHLTLADYAAAQRCLQASATLRRSVPDGYEQARLCRNLGDLAHATGQEPVAVAHWELAVSLFRKANAPGEADRLQERMVVARPVPAGP